MIVIMDDKSNTSFNSYRPTQGHSSANLSSMPYGTTADASKLFCVSHCHFVPEELAKSSIIEHPNHIEHAACMVTWTLNCLIQLLTSIVVAGQCLVGAATGLLTCSIDATWRKEPVVTPGKSP